MIIYLFIFSYINSNHSTFKTVLQKYLFLLIAPIKSISFSGPRDMKNV